MACLLWRTGNTFSKKYTNGATAYLLEKEKREVNGQVVWNTKKTSLKTGDKMTADEIWHKYENEKNRAGHGLLVREKDFQSFLPEYLRIRDTDKDRTTVVRDRYVLGLFEKLIRPNSISQITVQDIERYKQDRKVTIADSSLKTELFCLSAFFSKAIQYKYISENPVKQIVIKKPLNEIPKYLTKEQFLRLLKAAEENKHPEGSIIQDVHFMILAFFFTGARLAELLRLTWQSVDMENGWILLRGKGNKERTVPMHPVLRKVLEPLAAERREGLVFANGDKPLHPRRVQKAIGMVYKRARLPGYSVHTLRHTFATHCVLNGIDIQTLQRYLGHTTLTPTMIYAKVTKDHIQASMQKLSMD